MIIRQMNKNDINRLIECIHTQAQDASVPESDKIDEKHLAYVIREALIDPRYYVSVATEQDHIIGFCAGMLTMKHWNPKVYGEIFFIYTHPEKRSKRLADGLYDDVCAWFEQNDCEYVLSSVLHFNEKFEPEEEYMRRARIYFKSKGMKPIGEYFIKGIERPNEGV